jgi:hypothetical protein
MLSRGGRRNGKSKTRILHNKIFRQQEMYTRVLTRGDQDLHVATKTDQILALSSTTNATPPTAISRLYIQALLNSPTNPKDATNCIDMCTATKQSVLSDHAAPRVTSTRIPSLYAASHNTPLKYCRIHIDMERSVTNRTRTNPTATALEN